MPGYIIHLAEAQKIIDILDKKSPKSENFKNDFLIGNLLPDTKLGSNKKTSHFWNDEEMKYLARKPDISLFLNKYSNHLSDPIVLGYYCHLLLDVDFIDSYWADEFVF